MNVNWQKIYNKTPEKKSRWRGITLVEVEVQLSPGRDCGRWRKPGGSLLGPRFRSWQTNHLDSSCADTTWERLICSPCPLLHHWELEGREIEPLELVRCLMVHFSSRLYTLDTVGSLKCRQIGPGPQIGQRASWQMCGEKLCLDPLLFAFASWLLLSGCRKVTRLLQGVSSGGLKGCWPKTPPQIVVPHPRLSWLLLAKLPKAGLWQCSWSSLLWQFSVENYSNWGEQYSFLIQSITCCGWTRTLQNTLTLKRYQQIRWHILYT